jgi:hypothetical protein
MGLWVGCGLLVAALLAAVLGSGGPAAASSGSARSASNVAPAKTLGQAGTLRYKRERVHISSGATVRSAHLGCGSGRWHAVGGGVRTVGFPPATFMLRSAGIDGSDGGLAPDDGWAASIRQTAGSPSTASVYSICAKVRGLKYQSETDLLGPGASSGALVSACSGGRRVVGGGVQITDSPPLTEVVGTNPFDLNDADKTPDDGWYILTASKPGANQAIISSQAICRRGGGLRYRERVAHVNPSVSQISRSTSCPKSRHVSSGGTFPTFQGSHVVNSFPVDGKDHDHVPDDGWTSTLSLDTPINEDVFFFSICSR